MPNYVFKSQSAGSPITKIEIIQVKEHGRAIKAARMVVHTSADSVILYKTMQSGFQLFSSASGIPLSCDWSQSKIVCTKPAFFSQLLDLLRDLSWVGEKNNPALLAFRKKWEPRVQSVAGRVDVSEFQRLLMVLAMDMVTNILSQVSIELPYDKASILFRFIFAPSYRGLHLGTLDFINDNREHIPRDVYYAAIALQSICQGVMHDDYAPWKDMKKVKINRAFRHMLMDACIAKLLQRYAACNDAQKFILIASLLAFREYNVLVSPDADLVQEVRGRFTDSIYSRLSWTLLWDHYQHPSLINIFERIGMRREDGHWDGERLAALYNALDMNVIKRFINIKQTSQPPKVEQSNAKTAAHGLN